LLTWVLTSPRGIDLVTTLRIASAVAVKAAMPSFMPSRIC
jgi:hypothetical protein